MVCGYDIRTNIGNLFSSKRKYSLLEHIQLSKPTDSIISQTIACMSSINLIIWVVSNNQKSPLYILSSYIFSVIYWYIHSTHYHLVRPWGIAQISMLSDPSSSLRSTCVPCAIIIHVKLEVRAILLPNCRWF